MSGLGLSPESLGRRGRGLWCISEGFVCLVQVREAGPPFGPTDG